MSRDFVAAVLRGPHEIKRRTNIRRFREGQHSFSKHNSHPLPPLAISQVNTSYLQSPMNSTAVLSAAQVHPIDEYLAVLIDACDTAPPEHQDRVRAILAEALRQAEQIHSKAADLPPPYTSQVLPPPLPARPSRNPVPTPSRTVPFPPFARSHSVSAAANKPSRSSESGGVRPRFRALEGLFAQRQPRAPAHLLPTPIPGKPFVCQGPSPTALKFEDFHALLLFRATGQPASGLQPSAPSILGKSAVTVAMSDGLLRVHWRLLALEGISTHEDLLHRANDKPAGSILVNPL
ncbi:hypothetical protein BDK51DRAFT_37466 [Blyttiomyces helicus]|uniref:Uncharacterized protein n=1 Tax=Blyttiomyces helicus TaxID=388810 RepID=A0A4P9WAA3_9FUNG|nr:hypothetical protein BDK51DRAFT_37466 [Blyttiomyces helicus]|eukprot:RKO89519.1 hypothetical protein BDK51DRAFT_37466 [Blyttiomyces helicus]